jgi:hypothetical protein
VILRWPIAFARFWWDFIVGDSIILAIGGIAVLGIAFAVSHGGAPRLGDVLIPLAVAATLAASLLRQD